MAESCPLAGDRQDGDMFHTGVLPVRGTIHLLWRLALNIPASGFAAMLRTRLRTQ